MKHRTNLKNVLLGHCRRLEKKKSLEHLRFQGWALQDILVRQVWGHNITEVVGEENCSGKEVSERNKRCQEGVEEAKIQNLIPLCQQLFLKWPFVQFVFFWDSWYFFHDL